MKIKVITPFTSQFNAKVIYPKDMILDMPEKRAKEVIEAGIAEAYTEETDDTKKVSAKKVDKVVEAEDPKKTSQGEQGGGEQ